MTEMYGSYSDEDLNEWERMTQNIRVLTSSAFGAWLLRRDKRIKERELKTGRWIADEVQLPDRVVLNYHCSVCGRKLVGYSTETLKDAPYCHCGARMEG